MKDIISIESVQRKFTKMISGMSGLSYHSRLKALNLESLELRMLRAGLLLAYKILFGLLRVNSDKFFTPRNQSQLDAGMWRYHANRMDARRSQFDLGRVVAYI